MISMKQKEKELHFIVNKIVDEVPTKFYTKTLRGLKLLSPKIKLEFIFSTDRDVLEDDYVVVMGKTEHCLFNPTLRQKLLTIYEK